LVIIKNYINIVFVIIIYTIKIIMAKQTNKSIICSECIEDFLKKDIYIALVPPKNDYYTFYCIDCIKKLDIKKYEPYMKKRKNNKN